jgi:ribosomal protein S18 acetylase RimI-like enzyme
MVYAAWVYVNNNLIVRHIICNKDFRRPGIYIFKLKVNACFLFKDADTGNSYIRGGVIFTSSTWDENKNLYLEDLFVDPESRGKGYGRALIEAVAAVGKEHGAQKLYWQTHRDNATAQKLYETLASKSEFVIYEKNL